MLFTKANNEERLCGKSILFDLLAEFSFVPDLCLTYVSNGNFAKEKLIAEKGEHREVCKV